MWAAGNLLITIFAWSLRTEVTPCASQRTTSPSIRQDLTLRWFTASTTSGKRSDQSLPRRVMRRMPTESLRAIRR